MMLDIATIQSYSRGQRTKMNAFEVLGLPSDATESEIQKAYYRKAKIYHPDHGGKAEDFLTLKKAYEILLDVARRNLIGDRAIFDAPSIRVKPSLSPQTSQLFDNLSLLQNRLNQNSKAQG